MKELKYNEILEFNRKFKFNSPEYKIAICSNIIVTQIKEILEYSLRRNNVNANVFFGDYDNIVQDSIKYQQYNAIIFFWETANFIDGLEYKIELLNNSDFNSLIQKIKSEIDIVFKNLEYIPLILFNKFSALTFENNTSNTSKLEELALILNDYVKKKLKPNTKIIDIDKVISKISINKSIDLRFYNSSKALYSIDFYKEYSNFVNPILMSVNGKSKKALIFDCDNTLWKGILGEDGFDKIKMFKSIQYLALELSKKGIIIGLCSKNNPEDVDEVLRKHEDIILQDKNIVIKSVNWNDKATNLKNIAKKLNIGLDSIVFIDDSSFEVNLIKEKLPMVSVFQVPRKEHEYYQMLKEIMTLFYNISETTEDLKKTQMYKEQIEREEEQEKIGDINEYLMSLELKINFFINNDKQIERISQMTQKTNQFNLTTKRYTESEITNFLENNYKIITINVSDKFGDNGIVGLAILEFINNYAIIDSFLMSCRVLGRNVEYKFMDIIVSYLKEQNIELLYSKYIPTLKNKQVENLYSRFGFTLENKDTNYSKYSLNVNEYSDSNINYIKVNNGK